MKLILLDSPVIHCDNLHLTVSPTIREQDPIFDNKEQQPFERTNRLTQAQLDLDINEAISSLFHGKPLVDPVDHEHEMNHAMRATRDKQDSTHFQEGRKGEKDEHQKAVSKLNTSKKPVIVLVHGGSTDSRTYRLLVPLLSKAGYTVCTPDMTSSTTIPAVPDWSQDVAIVATALKSEIDKGNEVFVVAHSYGAAVVCQAMDGIPIITPSFSGGVFKGGVVKLGFIAGIIPQIGQRFSIVQAEETSRVGGGITMKDDLVSINDSIRRLYGDLPLTEANECAKDMMPMSRFALSSRCTHLPNPNIPTAYLLCEQDQVISCRMQKVIATTHFKSNITRINHGHAPFAGAAGAEKVAFWIRHEAGEVFAKL